ncbi:cysteine-rich venom protein-like isoform X2 [Culex pipiens pallens]|uniref:cysteine-rich venom protein-like isoform X2 n=1 Tax=Culex pipiens pallens TaxID=42434 RepID=UPI0019546C6D|nr:cysteine-rich venom protein-like isoform X2 [Culex pipiens pallens]
MNLRLFCLVIISNLTMVKLSCLIVFLALSLDVSHSWKFDRLPRLYGDKLPTKVISPRTRKVQRRIVVLHDFFRTKVVPPAANMLSMKWHHGAARSAQKWADQCRLLTHDSPKGRWIDNYGACGQNIFVSTHKVPWLFALRTWFLERQNFTYASPKNDLVAVGHYTQMVWAATHKVGCGLAKCARGGPRGKPYFNYVCNYCPIGNHEDKLGLPYRRGKPCSSCHQHCHSKKIKLCTNTCSSADLWANCKELYKTWPGWLCNTVTPEGLERQRNCLATCTCHGKIHD